MEIDDHNVLCPYCQSECGDNESFEGHGWSDAVEDFTCEDCGKNFSGERVVTIDYRTEKDCKKNGEEHEAGDYHCTKCDTYNCWFEKKDAPCVVGEK